MLGKCNHSRYPQSDRAPACAAACARRYRVRRTTRGAPTRRAAPPIVPSECLGTARPCRDACRWRACRYHGVSGAIAATKSCIRTSPQRRYTVTPVMSSVRHDFASCNECTRCNKEAASLSQSLSCSGDRRGAAPRAQPPPSALRATARARRPSPRNERPRFAGAVSGSGFSIPRAHQLAGKPTHRRTRPGADGVDALEHCADAAPIGVRVGTRHRVTSLVSRCR